MNYMMSAPLRERSSAGSVPGATLFNAECSQSWNKIWVWFIDVGFNPQNLGFKLGFKLQTWSKNERNQGEGTDP